MKKTITAVITMTLSALAFTASAIDLETVKELRYAPGTDIELPITEYGDNTVCIEYIDSWGTQAASSDNRENYTYTISEICGEKTVSDGKVWIKNLSEMTWEEHESGMGGVHTFSIDNFEEGSISRVKSVTVYRRH